MSMVVCPFAALSVAILYYCWRAHHERIVLKHRQLRERVTYLLWVIADSMPG